MLAGVTVFTWRFEPGLGDELLRSGGRMVTLWVVNAVVYRALFVLPQGRQKLSEIPNVDLQQGS